ncbi:hypothetical protein V1290_004524 [Bradyrhizobium sp. AZCC 1578]
MSPLRTQGPIHRGPRKGHKGRRLRFDNVGWWLWVPAFAGTTMIVMVHSSAVP